MRSLKCRVDPVTGLTCREDGAVFIPKSGPHPAHWTTGYQAAGYCYIQYKGERHAVHRLICRAFHGLPPEGRCEVDHIDRTRDNNRPDNLHWVSHSENQLNHGVPRDKGVAEQERVSFAHRFQTDAEFRERHRERCRNNKRVRAAEMRAQGFGRRKGPDGKSGWFPRIRAINKNQGAKNAKV